MTRWTKPAEFQTKNKQKTKKVLCDIAEHEERKTNVSLIEFLALRLFYMIYDRFNNCNWVDSRWQ